MPRKRTYTVVWPGSGRSVQASDIIVTKDPCPVALCAGKVPVTCVPGRTPIGLIRRFLTFLAKMGLSVRDDPKKVVDVAGRVWGEPVGGLALSLELKRKEDPDELATVSAAVHNRSAETQRLTTRGWLNFYQVSVVGSDGHAVALTPYGGELAKPERQPAPAEIVLAPGEAIEADIPIGSIYQMRKGHYSVQASAGVPGGLAVSNEISVGV